MTHHLPSAGTPNASPLREHRLIYRESPQPKEQVQVNSEPVLQENVHDADAAMQQKSELIRSFGEAIPVAKKIRQRNSARTTVGRQICDDYERAQARGCPMPPTIVQKLRDCPEPPPSGMQKILQTFASDATIKPKEARYEALVSVLTSRTGAQIDSTTHSLGVSPRKDGGFSVYAWERSMKERTNDTATTIVIFDAQGNFVKIWKEPQDAPRPQAPSPVEQKPTTEKKATTKPTPQPEKPMPKATIPEQKPAEKQPTQETPKKSEVQIARAPTLEELQTGTVPTEKAQRMLADPSFRFYNRSPERQVLLQAADEKYGMKPVSEERMKDYSKREYALTIGDVEKVDEKDIVQLLRDMRLQENEIHTLKYDEIVSRLIRRIVEKYTAYAKQTERQAGDYYYDSVSISGDMNQLSVSFNMRVRDNKYPAERTIIGHVTHALDTNTYEVTTEEMYQQESKAENKRGRIGIAGENGQKPSDGKFVVDDPDLAFAIIKFNREKNPTNFVNITQTKVKEFTYMKSLFTAETVEELKTILSSPDRNTVDVREVTWRTQYLTYLDSVHGTKPLPKPVMAPEQDLGKDTPYPEQIQKDPAQKRRFDENIEQRLLLKETFITSNIDAAKARSILADRRFREKITSDEQRAALHALDEKYGMQPISEERMKSYNDMVTGLKKRDIDSVSKEEIEKALESLSLTETDIRDKNYENLGRSLRDMIIAKYKRYASATERAAGPNEYYYGFTVGGNDDGKRATFFSRVMQNIQRSQLQMDKTIAEITGTVPGDTVTVTMKSSGQKITVDRFEDALDVVRRLDQEEKEKKKR